MANQEERKSNAVDSVYMPIPGKYSTKKRNLPSCLPYLWVLVNSGRVTRLAIQGWKDLGKFGANMGKLVDSVARFILFPSVFYGRLQILLVDCDHLWTGHAWTQPSAAASTAKPRLHHRLAKLHRKSLQSLAAEQSSHHERAAMRAANVGNSTWWLHCNWQCLGSMARVALSALSALPPKGQWPAATAHSEVNPTFCSLKWGLAATWKRRHAMRVAIAVPRDKHQSWKHTQHHPCCIKNEWGNHGKLMAIVAVKHAPIVSYFTG